MFNVKFDCLEKRVGVGEAGFENIALAFIGQTGQSYWMIRWNEVAFGSTLFITFPVFWFIRVNAIRFRPEWAVFCTTYDMMTFSFSGEFSARIMVQNSLVTFTLLHAVGVVLICRSAQNWSLPELVRQNSSFIVPILKEKLVL